MSTFTPPGYLTLRHATVLAQKAWEPDTSDEEEAFWRTWGRLRGLLFSRDLPAHGLTAKSGFRPIPHGVWAGGAGEAPRDKPFRIPGRIEGIEVRPFIAEADLARILATPEKSLETANHQPQPVPPKPASPRGPKPRLDWPVIRGKAFELLNYYGGVGPDEPEMANQEALVQRILDFCQEKWPKIEPPSPQLARRHARRWLAEYASGVRK